MLFVLVLVVLVTCLRGWRASVEGVTVVLAWGRASMSVVGGMLA